MSVDLAQLPGFALASLVVVLTPGVDSFLLLRTSLHQGVRRGLLALAGIHTGTAIQVGAVICGLGALITSTPSVISVLKWAGAAYLVYLAVTIMRGLWLARKQSVEPDGKAEQADAANPYVRGFLSNITNPKMLLFSLAFLPQFVGSAADPTLQLVVLAGAFLVLAAIWEVAIVLAASRIADRLRRPEVTRALDAVCAVAFLTISAGLVAS